MCHFLTSGHPLPHGNILEMLCLVKISGNMRCIPVANLPISRCDESDVPWQCHYFVCGFLPQLLRLPCNKLISLWMAGQRLFSYACLAKTLQIVHAGQLCTLGLVEKFNFRYAPKPNKFKHQPASSANMERKFNFKAGLFSSTFWFEHSFGCHLAFLVFVRIIGKTA